MLLRHRLASLILSTTLLGTYSASASAADVKTTPLGSHEREFCAFDRAMAFEDPNGLRILYDAGRTIAGPEDPRLGDIDTVLISHVHGDHLGDRRIAVVNQGTCAEPALSRCFFVGFSFCK